MSAHHTHHLRPAKAGGEATPSGPVVSPSTGLAIPYGLAEKAVNRLGWIAFVYAVSYPGMYLMYRSTLGSHLTALPIHAALTVVASLVGVALCVTAWSGRFSPKTVLDLGLIFEVAAALLISCAESSYPLAPHELVRGQSAVSIWVVLFVLVVPVSLGKATIAALATACMGPLGMMVNIVVTGVPVPTIEQWIMFYASSFLMVAAAVILSRYIYNLGAHYSRQTELGSYELIELIGRGGMGEVWKARHRLLVRKAAIKLIRPETLGGGSQGDVDAARLRFEREAKATATLHSPHTVAIHDYGVTDDGAFYYVMELLEGLDLEALVEKYGPLPPNRVIWILRQACDSLAEAHAAGLTHRDVKPRNIFLCRLGLNFDCVKVLDFGLVKIRGADQVRLTREGVTTGTPAYMAPEMAMGHFEIDGRADIYALGCVAYWLLTGKLVFNSTTPLGMALEHIKTMPTPPSQHSEIEIPAELDQIVLRCLEKKPSDRPQSVRELSRALARVPVTPAWSNELAEEWWRIHLPPAAADAALAG